MLVTLSLLIFCALYHYLLFKGLERCGGARRRKWCVSWIFDCLKAIHFWQFMYLGFFLVVLALCCYFLWILPNGDWLKRMLRDRAGSKTLLLTIAHRPNSFLYIEANNSSGGHANITKMILEENVTKILRAWHKETESFVENSYLWYLSLLTPVWLVGTFFVSCGHQLKMLCRGKDLHGEHIDGMHAISALPQVYCLMAFWAHCHCWQTVAYGPVLAVQHWGTFEHTAAALQLAYQAAIGCADLYEAVVIYLFAFVTLQVLDFHTRTLSPTGGSQVERQRTPKTTELLLLMDLRQSTVVVGISWFCVICFGWALYMMLPVLVYDFYNSKREHWILNQIYTEKQQTTASVYVNAAGGFTSCIAIQNLVSLEMNHKNALHDMNFNAVTKFLSAKILVSIVFIQDIIFSFVLASAFSQTTKYLFQSSLLCFECFCLAILHCFAWRTTESWVNDVARHHCTERVGRSHSSSSRNSCTTPTLEEEVSFKSAQEEPLLG